MMMMMIMIMMRCIQNLRKLGVSCKMTLANLSSGHSRLVSKN